jgi:hypothetical protein
MFESVKRAYDNKVFNDDSGLDSGFVNPNPNLKILEPEKPEPESPGTIGYECMISSLFVVVILKN